MAAEPHHEHGRDVDHEHDHRHHRRHEESGLQIVPGEVLVGFIEPADLVVLPDKAADDIRTDDLLPQHPADPVQEALALAVQGNQAADDHRHDHRQDRDHHDHNPGQHHVLVHGQHDAADEDRHRSEERRVGKECEVLDLGDVVGGPGHEAGRTEKAHLLG